jgi:hypothetical protein
MKTILFAFLTVLTFFANAQNYLVTLKMDTLRGDVRILTYGTIDRPEVNSPEGKKHFTAIQVKTVFINNEVFNPVRTENGYRMMKLVSSGFLSLYLGRQPNGFEYDTQYLVKRDGSSIEVPNLSYKKVVSNFLKDCSTLSNRIKQDEFSRKDINKLISEYNNCLDLQTKQSNLSSSAALEDPTLIALNTLKGKIANSSIASKKDALDVLTDIGGKVASGQTIPNYLTESFRSFFKDAPELQPEVESFLVMLKK